MLHRVMAFAVILTLVVSNLPAPVTAQEASLAPSASFLAGDTVCRGLTWILGGTCDPAPVPTQSSATATTVPATSTSVPPTATMIPSPTPTATAANTPEPTATNTPAPTETNTPEPTATNTPEPTATNTSIPPTVTATTTPQPTATSTSVSPTATDTPEPTATNTPVPPSATSTNTPEPTATNTPTNTPVPATATATNTPTNTPVPPTATATDTPTNTPVPPTATATDTPTPTNTMVPPTATDTPTPTNTPEPTTTNTPEPTATTGPVSLVTGLIEWKSATSVFFSVTATGLQPGGYVHVDVMSGDDRVTGIGYGPADSFGGFSSPRINHAFYCSSNITSFVMTWVNADGSPGSDTVIGPPCSTLEVTHNAGTGFVAATGTNLRPGEPVVFIGNIGPAGQPPIIGGHADSSGNFSGSVNFANACETGIDWVEVTATTNGGFTVNDFVTLPACPTPPATNTPSPTPTNTPEPVFTGSWDVPTSTLNASGSGLGPGVYVFIQKFSGSTQVGPTTRSVVHSQGTITIVIPMPDYCAQNLTSVKLTTTTAGGDQISTTIDLPPCATPTATSTPEPTATNTPEPTATATPSPTPTNTLEPTAAPAPDFEVRWENPVIYGSGQGLLFGHPAVLTVFYVNGYHNQQSMGFVDQNGVLDAAVDISSYCLAGYFPASYTVTVLRADGFEIEVSGTFTPPPCEPAIQNLAPDSPSPTPEPDPVTPLPDPLLPDATPVGNGNSPVRRQKLHSGSRQVA